jgi:hypothetical protein
MNRSCIPAANKPRALLLTPSGLVWWAHIPAKRPCEHPIPSPPLSLLKMDWMTSRSVRWTLGLSGGGRYCSTRRHLTWGGGVVGFRV